MNALPTSYFHNVGIPLITGNKNTRTKIINMRSDEMERGLKLVALPPQFPHNSPEEYHVKH